MRSPLKRKYIFLILLFLVIILFIFCLPSICQSDEIHPPDVILNDQKIIFNRKPVLDEEGWLFPLEEIASKLQDKVNVDIVNGIITIKRNRDKSIIELNIKNGTVTVNNRPFKTLFGFNRIILGPNSQMVPTSALVILLGLASLDKDDKLILKNTIGTDTGNFGTVQPLSRKGIKDLLVDYLTVTNAFDYIKTQGLYTRRTEINSGFHNDNYALTSDLLVKAGTNSGFINFDTANFSYYKNASPFQAHIGDKPLSLIKSPLLGGITIRGIQVQTGNPLKDSRFVFSSGLLPTNGKILGKALPFVQYGRLTEIAEWSTSPKKDWQFSVGEATYNDLITNQLVRTQQSGGLFALSATKTGKYIEGISNIGVGITNDKVTHKSTQGPCVDLLVRFKPKDWLSFFTKGAYYSPGFFSLSGNPYYHDRNEGTFGIDLSPPRSNIGFSHSIGKFNLNNNKPNNYNVTNIFASSTPIKNGPTIVASYSKNLSQISSTRLVDNILFPINQFTPEAVDLETLIERRTNSFFRASLLKSWKTANFSSSFNYFTFANSSALIIPMLNGQSVTKLWTYDFNFNKYLSRTLGLQSYFQGSELYKQVRFGINLGPILNNKLNLQLLSGALFQLNGKYTPIYSANLNYLLNKKTQLYLKYDKTAFLTSLAVLWQYNLRAGSAGQILQAGEEQSIGRIKGRVIVLEEIKKDFNPRGIANVRIHLGNYTIVTDDSGTFEFPSLTPGIHRVRVEYSDLPSYLTSITPEGVDLKVEEGKETNFNFVLAYFGSLSGKLQLANEPQMKLEKEIELQDIRVYLDSSEFETLTNIDGSFVLGDVKPGKYKLKVDPDFLPPELEIEKKELEVNIHSKKKVENIQLPIKFKTKPQEIKEF